MVYFKEDNMKNFINEIIKEITAFSCLFEDGMNYIEKLETRKEVNFKDFNR